jgi:hypothetical protein
MEDCEEKPTERAIPGGAEVGPDFTIGLTQP